MNDNTFKLLVKERVFSRGTKDTPIALRGANVYRDAPWIFDFRSVIFDPEVLSYIATRFWDLYASRYPFQVGGMESASIPLITAVVLEGTRRNMPVHGFYIRKSRKQDGLMNVFEGGLTDEPVILVDDIINSGQSIHKQILLLAEAGRQVTDIFVLLAYRSLEAYTFAHARNIRISPLMMLTDLDMPLLGSNRRDIPRASFETLWRFAAGSPRHSFVVEKSAPVLHADALFFGSDDSTMWSLDASSGAVRWKFKTGRHPKGIFSTPAVTDETVYFGAYDGSVYALDAKTGSRRWEYACADWIGSSPALAADLDLLYVGLEFALPGTQGGIAALSIKTGRPVWIDRTREHTHGSPLYIPSSRTVVIGSNDNTLYAYDASTGERRWSYVTRGEIKASCAFDSKRSLIFFGSWDGKLYALNENDGTQAFSFQTDGPIFSTPLIDGDMAYIGSLDKRVYAIDLVSQTLRWVFETSGRVFASPVLAQGSLWIGSNDGRLYELDPKDGTLKNFFQATECIVNSIAYDEKRERVILPTTANELYCIKRK